VDGGFLLGGSSGSGIGGDKSEPNRGTDNSSDYWIVKIDKNGNKLWDKTYGGNGPDLLSAVVATEDGGYLLAGSCIASRGGDKTTGTSRFSEYWIVKVDKEGNKEWDKAYGASYDVFRAI